MVHAQVLTQRGLWFSFSLLGRRRRHIRGFVTPFFSP